MTSSKPYLLRALYEWILDNNYTPQIIVNRNIEGVALPTQFAQQDHINLNISPNAVRKLLINEDGVEFDARFGGMIRHIYVPLKAVESIYALENERGMMFGSEDDIDDDDEDDRGEENVQNNEEISENNQEADKPEKPPKPPRGKPDLKIVK